MTAMQREDHGWRGPGKARVARLDGRLLVRYEGLSTRGGRLQAPIAELFRKRDRNQRPSWQPFAVTIWIETAGTAPKKLDLDNVAKACLDALTGVVWHDDSQVRSLSLERLPAERSAITLVIEPAGAASSEALERLLALAESAGPG